MSRDTERMLGESPAFLQMQEALSRLAQLNRPALVIGERGTGKELVAGRLHYLSTRWQQPFLSINCAAFNDNLLESHLFGHESGAFTGATRSQKGLFERAQGGTLFLDEVANSSLAVQEKLLRIVEYGEFERLGGNRTLTVDVRLIAATNEDLPSLVRAGRFRADLLDRLAFDVLTLPPLRERVEDILLLAEHFAFSMTQELGRDYFAGFADSALEQLLTHPWPGNVRELKSTVERSIYRSEPEEPLATLCMDPFDSPFRPGSAIPDNRKPGQVLAQDEKNGKVESEAKPEAATEGPCDLKTRVKTLELGLIRQALADCQHHQGKAAAWLGLSYDQLRGYLRKYARELERD